MQFKLEQLDYQKNAVNSIIKVFQGNDKNTFDNAFHEGIRYNYLSISDKKIQNNIKEVLEENGITKDAACLSDDNDFCIEMETGTGKTLVYLKSICELNKHYGFTKFIILVPSVAIKEGVLTSFETFKDQLEEIYGFKANCFDYDSRKISKVKNFVEEHHPQIMIMTLQSFNTDDRILNQSKREDLFSNMPFIKALSMTKPVIIMDEPQEGMDTDNSLERINKLNPLCKLRFSATHKVMKNLIYRLTPYQSYKMGIVKKIEVLSVAEINDEATLKIEVVGIKTFKDGKEPQIKLKAWKYSETKKQYELKDTQWLSVGDRLEEKTKNVSYRTYNIKRIYKPLREKYFKVEFSNGVELVEKEQAKDYKGIFSEQLYYLCDTHFRKKEKLKDKGIKCLSLIFIDRVDNYVKEDGIIKKLFREQYKRAYIDYYKKEPPADDMENVQGYYFASSGKGEFTDNERSILSNKEIFDQILKDKETLLSFDSPIEFIFSHSALGVGWDNPNVFNIATLNQSYSEIKKRQEIGRGLRIAVNQKGERSYDPDETKEGEELNLLTVIPNESYESFVLQYQGEIKEIYGTIEAGAATRYRKKGEDKSGKTLTRRDDIFESESFREFWKLLSLKTDYVVVFDEKTVIEKSLEKINEITVSEYEALITLNKIKDMDGDKIDSQNLGSQKVKLRGEYSPIDMIEEISENTQLSYTAVVKIIGGIININELVKNPVLYLQKVVMIINQIELREMLRGLEYRVNGEKFELDKFEKYIPSHAEENKIVDTSDRALYDKIVTDSEIERDFVKYTNHDPDVVCFLKLPDFYKIKTPIGTYNPDFGIVIKKKKIHEGDEHEFYFVIETKGTSNIFDEKAISESAIYKIKCAKKHFESLGIETRINYMAPVKDYPTFKKDRMEVMK
jgi:type III restriction enzyme